jgi:hypothetical protein
LSEDAQRGVAARFVAPGILLAFAVLYMALVHHGLGPRPEVSDSELHWWSPRGFWTQALLGTSWEWLIDQRGKGMLALGAPSLALLLGVWATTRSALARVTALVAFFATLCFLYYALGSGVTQVAWNFFHWRASGTILAVAAVIGCAVGSPWLAAGWLSLGWPARLAWFLPVLALVLVVERNVTGTNPTLPFAISPWPAVQVFGFEAIGTTIAALLAGTALALAGLRAWRKSKRLAAGALALLAGVAVPAFAWRTLAALEQLPFRVTQERLIGIAITCGVFVAIAAAGVRFDPRRLRTRALHMAVAAALVGIPLFIGTAWARWDYSTTRDREARKVIEALAAYYQRDSVYPDTLEQLVEANLLETIPKPRIGFGFAGDGDSSFVYQAFGTSYLLEFSAPRWVQCAYNPPYFDEEADLEPSDVDVAEGDGGQDAAADEERDDLGGSWSCPSKPPELW